MKTSLRWWSNTNCLCIQLKHTLTRSLDACIYKYMILQGKECEWMSNAISTVRCRSLNWKLKWMEMARFTACPPATLKQIFWMELIFDTFLIHFLASNAFPYNLLSVWKWISRRWERNKFRPENYEILVYVRNPNNQIMFVQWLGALVISVTTSAMKGTYKMSMSANMDLAGACEQTFIHELKNWINKK